MSSQQYMGGEQTMMLAKTTIKATRTAFLQDHKLGIFDLPREILFMIMDFLIGPQIDERRRVRVLNLGKLPPETFELAHSVSRDVRWCYVPSLPLLQVSRSMNELVQSTIDRLLDKVDTLLLTNLKHRLPEALMFFPRKKLDKIQLDKIHTLAMVFPSPLGARSNMRHAFKRLFSSCSFPNLEEIHLIALIPWQSCQPTQTWMTSLKEAQTSRYDGEPSALETARQTWEEISDRRTRNGKSVTLILQTEVNQKIFDSLTKNYVDRLLVVDTIVATGEMRERYSIPYPSQMLYRGLTWMFPDIEDLEEPQ